MGNLVTFAAGFLLASKGQWDLLLFILTFLGLALIMASACVFNNYIDRDLDQKMERTKNRAIAAKTISAKNALLFGAILGVLGFLALYLFTNPLTVLIAAIGFFVYVVLYSMWKSHTVYGTAIGSIAGAVPPIVGYCAVSNAFDLGAVIFFSMMVLWQMPHFFAIAIMHYEDYAAAKIPVLPIEKGMLRTKIHMTAYIAAFIAVSALLTVYGYTGYAYLVIATLLGIVWLFMSIQGFYTANDKLWGQQMFRWSLCLITIICFVIPMDLTTAQF